MTINPNLKKALYSILIGAAIMALNQIVAVLLEFLKSNQEILIPSVTGMIHYLKSWKTSA